MKKNSYLAVMLLTASLIVAPLAPSAVAATRASKRSTALQQDGADPSTAEQDMFLQAQRLYEKNQFEQSVKVLQDLLKTYPQSSISDLTLLWLARSYIGLNNLREAERVGARLKLVRDTPFLEIYEAELGDARRRMGGDTALAQNQTPTVTPTPEQIAQNNQRPTLTNVPESRTPSNTAEPRTTPRPPRARLITGEPREGSSTTVPVATERPTQSSNTDVARPNQPRPRANRRQITGPRQTIVVGPNANAGSNTSVAANTPVETPVVVPSPETPTEVARVEPTPVTTNSAEPTYVSTTEQSAQGGQSGSGSGFSLTIKQVPSLSLALRNSILGASPGQVVSLPLVVTNTGNKEDQFRIETDLPAEFQPTFSSGQSASDTGLPILVTPQVARGGTIEVQLNMRVPENVGDGQQRRFLVRAASQFDTQIERVADASINVVAAALAATSAVSQPSVQPGETFAQTIQIRNQGSAPARSARAEFVFDPDFELVSATPSPLVYDRASRTAVWSLGEMGARDGREISVNLRAIADSLAASKALGRGTLRTSSLPVPSNFDGPSVAVGRVTRARIDPVSPGLTATPGDTIFMPFVVRNPSNYPEAFELRITAPGAPAAIIFADTNGDGQHQEGEPAVTQTTPVESRGGQYPVLLRIEIPRTTADRQQFGYNIVARSITNNRVASEGSTVLTVAAPRVRIRTEQVSSEGTAGDTIFYRLVLVNEGAGLARGLVVTEELPTQLQFVSSDPTLNPQDIAGDAQRLTWRVPDLAPGDTSVLRITVKLRPNIAAGVDLRTKSSLVYQDPNGNSYRGQ